MHCSLLLHRLRDVFVMTLRLNAAVLSCSFEYSGLLLHVALHVLHRPYRPDAFLQIPARTRHFDFSVLLVMETERFVLTAT